MADHWTLGKNHIFYTGGENDNVEFQIFLSSYLLLITFLSISVSFCEKFGGICHFFPLLRGENHFCRVKLVFGAWIGGTDRGDWFPMVDAVGAEVRD